MSSAAPTGRCCAAPMSASPTTFTDPEPLAAAAGLAKHQSPVELGGVGEIWIFRKA